jgi:hypothetical protein
MEGDCTNKANLGPPSTTEDQNTDDSLEDHQQTDEQEEVKRTFGATTARHAAVTQSKCAWSAKLA